MVGNKLDLSNSCDKRIISEEEGARKASSLGALFIETSAKTGHNVRHLFTRLAHALPGQDNNFSGLPERDSQKRNCCNYLLMYHLVIDIRYDKGISSTNLPNQSRNCAC